MDKVSPEILHMVCAFLDVKDARNFRLVCKVFGDIGAHYSLPEVVFYLHHEDFTMLRSIASRPLIASHVKTLSYQADYLHSRPLDFEKYRRIYEEKHRMQNHMRRFRVMKNIPEAPGAGSLSRLSPAQLADNYQKLVDVLAEQDYILENDLDFALLQDVLPKLRGLQTIIVSSDSWARIRNGDQRHPDSIKTPFDAFYQRRSYVFEEQAVRQFKSILRAIIKADDAIKIRQLTVGTLYWRFFDRNMGLLNEAVPLLLNLTCLELHIETGGSAQDHGEDDPAADVEVEKCGKLLRTGVLRNFLMQLPNLKTLCLGFTMIKNDLICPAGLGDIVEPGHKWPYLEDLTLQDIDYERQELVAFLELHKQTLKHLCLRDPCLRSTSWARLLPEMSKHLSLKSSCLCGALFGRGEPPHSDSEEFLILGSTYGNETLLGMRINDYLTGHGECPINDENWDKVLEDAGIALEFLDDDDDADESDDDWDLGDLDNSEEEDFFPLGPWDGFPGLPSDLDDIPPGIFGDSEYEYDDEDDDDPYDGHGTDEDEHGEEVDLHAPHRL